MSVNRAVAQAAIVVGLLSGAAAILLHAAFAGASEILLGRLGGYLPPSADHRPSATIDGRQWAVPAVAAGGALLAVVISRWLAPNSGREGTDGFIRAAQLAPAAISVRTAGVKAAASAVVVGAGGSAGNEGPMVQLGGALGSAVARRASLPREQGRRIVLTGAGAGIGAIFGAPLAGVLIGAELLYRRGLDGRVMPPALLAGVVSSALFCLVYGGHTWGDQGRGFDWQVEALLVFGALGVLCGLTGRLYVAALTVGTSASDHLASVLDRWLPRGAVAYVLPVTGAALVGCIGVLVPETLGTGYGIAQSMMDHDRVTDLSVTIVVILPLLKIAATALTIGTGNPGGLFGPCLVIGATTGYACGVAYDVWGDGELAPAAVAIVGMAACLGSIAHAPIGVSVLALELTHAVDLVVPIVVAVACARFTVGNCSLYPSQLRSTRFRNG